MSIDIFKAPTPATWHRAASKRLDTHTGLYDLLDDLLARAEGMAGLLANAAYAEDSRPQDALHAPHVAAAAFAIQDELRMALVLLHGAEDDARQAQATAPGGDG